MNAMKYLYGPVPSRRLGISLGVSPIPKKTCNYSCVYCQLGQTTHMTHQRKMFFPVADMIEEFVEVLSKNDHFDVVTIVGEGEPTLYLGLGTLISVIKEKTDKPAAVITNGALLYDQIVQKELAQSDIVLPSMDAYDEASFKKICRPYGGLTFKEVHEGLIDFSNHYQGQLWLEIMLIEGMNDSEQAIDQYKALLKMVRYDKLYLNTPIRPPAEPYVRTVTHEFMNEVSMELGGISIDLLASEGFHSEIEDHTEAIMSIIKRHPMNQHEIESFLKSRHCDPTQPTIEQLKRNETIKVIRYKGYETFRLR